VVALQSFSHEWKHKAGKENPADGLSRIEGSTAGSGLVVQNSSSESSETLALTGGHPTGSLPAAPLVSAVAEDTSLQTEFKSAYNEDAVLQKLINKKQVNFWRDMWYFKGKLYVPATLVTKVLAALHDDMYSGMHLGLKKTLSKVGQKFYWPTWRKDTEQYVSLCEVCQKAKPSNVRYGLLSPLPVPDKPFSSISMDFVTALPQSGDKQYDALLTVVDRLTKFCILLPCHSSITGLETARMLHSNIF
jgi:hypothetical protein